MEANDAKTGVHCPRPWLEPESGREREREGRGRRNRERTGGSYAPPVDPCIPTFFHCTDPTEKKRRRRRRRREREERRASLRARTRGLRENGGI